MTDKEIRVQLALGTLELDDITITLIESIKDDVALMAYLRSHFWSELIRAQRFKTASLLQGHYYFNAPSRCSA